MAREGRYDVLIVDDWDTSGLRGTGLPDTIADAQRTAAAAAAYAAA